MKLRLFSFRTTVSNKICFSALECDIWLQDEVWNSTREDPSIAANWPERFSGRQSLDEDEVSQRRRTMRRKTRTRCWCVVMYENVWIAFPRNYFPSINISIGQADKRLQIGDCTRMNSMNFYRWGDWMTVEYGDKAVFDKVKYVSDKSVSGSFTCIVYFWQWKSFFQENFSATTCSY